jgi:hypothetical protein
MVDARRMQGQVAYPQVLDNDEAVVPGELGSRTVQPVLAAAGLLGPQPGNLVDGPAVPLRHWRVGLAGELLASGLAFQP